MRVLIAPAIAGLLAFVPLAAQAQAPKPDAHHPPSAAGAPSTGGGTMGGGMMHRGAMMPDGMMGGMMVRHVEGRLAFLKAELKVTPAQDAPWSKCADAVRAATTAARTALKPMMQPGGSPPRTAVEQMSRHESLLSVRLESVRRVKAAFEPLYAALDEEQRKLADSLVGEVIGTR
ncbi:MAG: Spy/CpxP family protein refolding chaperone [Alphaproteobacteria bacterium]|nr:Spy/CpxP family protein refolding chaperone [Alphaproteobacteria bacterium]MCW5741361.1 Spy/CpxP family protein refolding chaperone [Alphaproteobacteria bacterium]